MAEIIPVSKFKVIQDYGIEDGMLKLCEYGKPRLCSHGNGEWHCAVEMFVQGKGITFNITSEFTEKSMLIAVHVCIERLKKALTDLGV